MHRSFTFLEKLFERVRLKVPVTKTWAALEERANAAFITEDEARRTTEEAQGAPDSSVCARSAIELSDRKRIPNDTLHELHRALLSSVQPDESGAPEAQSRLIAQQF